MYPLGTNNFLHFARLDLFRQGYCVTMPCGKEDDTMFNNKTKEMQKAIDMAWSHPTKEQKLFQERYFPSGKPTVEEFIKTVTNIAKQKNRY